MLVLPFYNTWIAGMYPSRPRLGARPTDRADAFERPPTAPAMSVTNPFTQHLSDRPIQGFRWSIADCRSPKTQALPAAAGGRSRARVSAASVADYDAMPVFDDARARSRRNFRSAANRETTKMIKLSHSKHWPHAPLLARKAGS